MSTESRRTVIAVLHAITSDTANLACIRKAVLTAAVDAGFSEAVASRIALAVDEAVSNVIKHGYEGRSGQPIEVGIETVQRGNRNGLQVTVCDCARQVDPSSFVGRPLDDVRPGGLGTHIIRNIMDEVEYSFRQPLGMRLRMVKLLDADDGKLT